MTAPYCQRLRERFDAYHDGELSAFLHKVVRRHLETCPACADEYRLLERAIDTVRRIHAPEVPPRVLRKVVENLSGPGGGATFPERLAGPDLAQGFEAL